MPETVVLLHGFAGTRRAWDDVCTLLDHERYRPLALDLPGHGGAGGDGEITFAGAVQELLARAPARFRLCGYSLGARAALAAALAAPGRVSRLVLVSGTAGIADGPERAARRRADGALAERLERDPFEDFIATWREQPVFAGEPAEVAERARADHRRNDPRALARALRGLGTGAMEPMWGRLQELAMPLTLLVGERDAKFRLLGERIAERVAGAELLIVPGGHALHLENPAAVAAAIARP